MTNFAIHNRAVNFGFVTSGGITRAATVTTRIMFDGNISLQAFGITPDANGIYRNDSGVGVTNRNYQVRTDDSSGGVTGWSSFIGYGE